MYIYKNCAEEGIPHRVHRSHRITFPDGSSRSVYFCGACAHYCMGSGTQVLIFVDGIDVDEGGLADLTCQCVQDDEGMLGGIMWGAEALWWLVSPEASIEGFPRPTMAVS